MPNIYINVSFFRGILVSLLLLLLAGCQVTTEAGIGGGISPDSLEVEKGETATFTIIPDEGYRIDEVTGCDGQLDGDQYTTAPIENDCTVSATFTPITITITPTVIGNGNLEPASVDVIPGETADFELLPDFRNRISYISGCGGHLNESIYTTAAIEDPCEIKVVFEEDPLVIITPVSGHTAKGQQADFGIMLTREPAYEVIMSVYSSDETQGKPDSSQIIFNADNWNKFQYIYVKGMGNEQLNGRQDYQIVLEPLLSSDTVFAEFNPDDIQMQGIVLTAQLYQSQIEYIQDQNKQIAITVTYNHNEKLKYELIGAPSGMTIAEEQAIISWTPQANQIGIEYPVIFKVSDSERSVEVEFTVLAHEVKAIETEYTDNGIILKDNEPTLNGVMIGSEQPENLNNAQISKISAENIPQYSQQINRISEIFNIANAETESATFKFPLDVNQNKIYGLYNLATPRGWLQPIWLNVRLNSTVENINGTEYIVFTIKNPDGNYFLGYQESEVITKTTSSLGNRKMAMAVTAEESICQPDQNAQTYKMDPYYDQNCTVGSDNNGNPVQIKLINFGKQADSKQWGLVTADQFTKWVKEAQEHTQESKLTIDEKMVFEFDNLGENYFGYYTPDNLTLSVPKQGMIYMNNWIPDEDLARYIKHGLPVETFIQKNIHHEYFHNAQDESGDIITIDEALWITEGSALWFEMYNFGLFNTKPENEIPAIMERGISNARYQYNASNPDDSKSPYLRALFFRMLETKCNFPTSNLRELFQSIGPFSEDRDYTKAFQGFYGNHLECDFQLGLPDALNKGIAGALLNYQLATQYHNDIKKIDPATNATVNFKQANKAVPQEIWHKDITGWISEIESNDDQSTKTVVLSSMLDISEPFSAHSIIIPEIRGEVPEGYEAVLKLTYSGTPLLSFVSDDTDFNASVMYGDLKGDFIDKTNKGQSNVFEVDYIYPIKEGGHVPSIMLTAVNPNVENNYYTNVQDGITFELRAKKYQLTVNTEGSASGKVYSYDSNLEPAINCGNDCSSNVPYKSTVTLTAYALAPYTNFIEWTEGPCAGSADSECTFEITGNIKISAKFEDTEQFIKLGADGFALDIQDAEWDDNGSEANGTQWNCILDNQTGLIWEVKTNDGGMRDGHNRFLWFNTDSNANGGNPGYNDAKTIPDNGHSYSGKCPAEGECDTEHYIAHVNKVALCGIDNWRLPTPREMMSIVDFTTSYPNVAIDTFYFPNTIGTHYWSSVTVTKPPEDLKYWSSYRTYKVGFNDGNISTHQRYCNLPVRLVSDGLY